MKKKIVVDGMHCASCASNIERSLRKIPEIENVSISVITKKAIVECEKEISDEKLAEAVKRAGYKVTEII